jgi:hypothetical protein
VDVELVQHGAAAPIRQQARVLVQDEDRALTAASFGADRHVMSAPLAKVTGTVRARVPLIVM